MEKVKVSKEVAEALDIVKSEWSINEILLFSAQQRFTGTKNRVLNGLNLEMLAKALLIGYEREKTPEEQLLSWFESSKKEYDKLRNMDTSDYSYEEKKEFWDEQDYFRVQIETLAIVIKMLKIKGVTD